jgi:hypothetical protein
MVELEECRTKFITSHSSPVTKTIKRLVSGDWDKGEFGVLVRTVDIFDEGEEAYKKHWKFKGFDNVRFPKLYFLPASFLHNRIRTPQAIFVGNKVEAFSVVVGTKYKQNWAMEGLQENGSVDCQVYYPTDAGTVTRGALEAPNSTLCRPENSGPCCVNGTCLASRDSACGECQLPGSMFGDHITSFFEEKAKKVSGLSFVSCWYPKSRQGLENVVAASNSIWRSKNRWFDPRYDFQGFTECTATTNIRNIDMIDAVLIPLYPGKEMVDLSLCEIGYQEEVERKLNHAYEKGYGALPVIFYREIIGLSPSDCQRLWGGIDCDQGYQKDFFSQEFSFGSGGCLHRPDGCKEVYYFPPEDVTNSHAGCSAFSENGAKRIAVLRAIENGTVKITDSESLLSSGVSITPPQFVPTKPDIENQTKVDSKQHGSWNSI